MDIKIRSSKKVSLDCSIKDLAVILMALDNFGENVCKDTFTQHAKLLAKKIK